MKKNKEELVPEPKSSGIQQHEDAVLKTSMQFFADEVLPYFGIKEKVVSFAPTEVVHLEVKKLYQDFNFVMESGNWLHFEFQSTNEGLKGLKRFRMYEASTSYQYNVEVTTYVLYSGKIKRPMIKYSEGINTYQVKPIIMQNKIAEEEFTRIQQKIEQGVIIKKEDLLPLVLCPLMAGEMSQKERFMEAYRIIQKAVTVDNTVIRKVETVLYAMADKFLDSMELEGLEEMVKMTRLGQMLIDDGIAQGKEIGAARFAKLTQMMLKEGKTEELMRATTDKEYLEQLYIEYQL